MKANRTLRASLAAALTTALLAFTAGGAAAQATIVINNTDGAGEGFNDPTPATPVGGNPGTTVGQQRLNAFQYAANILANTIESPVVIQVDAKMDPQTCTPTSAVLGSAGTTTIHRNFTGAPLSNTWYPQALANSLAGTDLSSSYADISATFNSNLNGDAGCLGGIGWYYGYDGNPGGDIDFISVVMHEICHGLGFQTFVNQSGAKYAGYNDMYMVHLMQNGASPSDYASMTDAQREAANISDPNLVWVGTYVEAEQALSAGMTAGHVRMHAPNPYQPGSSVSHWSTALTPNEVMEPAYTGANHNPGLAQSLFQDIGWVLSPTVDSAISWFRARAVDNGAELTARFSSTYDAVEVNVYRATGGGGFVLLDTQPADGTGDFVYRDTTTHPGGRYAYRIGVNDGDGELLSTVASVEMPGMAVALEQNVPNPFNPTTTIRFTLPSRSDVKLMVFDATGRLVRTLVDRAEDAGVHTALWDGRDGDGAPVSSGVYFCRMQAGSHVQSRKMVLLK
jgi:hypothetical protein